MEADFFDYYEILEISPNANSGTIERMFRYLAQRYHPDNRETGDRLRFDVVVDAHDTLRDPIKRAQYDIRYKERSRLRSQLIADAGDRGNIQSDIEVQNKLLALLYARRRQKVTDPGIGDLELELMSGCPIEQLEYHLWYLKEKGWIVRTENGTFAITVIGVDRANSEPDRKGPRKLLTGQTDAGDGSSPET